MNLRLIQTYDNTFNPPVLLAALFSAVAGHRIFFAVPLGDVSSDTHTRVLGQVVLNPVKIGRVKACAFLPVSPSENNLY
jgi:hypothetical protein